MNSFFLFIISLGFLAFAPNVLLAQDMNIIERSRHESISLAERQKLFEDSCHSGAYANCYELGKLFIESKADALYYENYAPFFPPDLKIEDIKERGQELSLRFANFIKREEKKTESIEDLKAAVFTSYCPKKREESCLQSDSLNIWPNELGRGQSLIAEKCERQYLESCLSELALELGKKRDSKEGNFARLYQGVAPKQKGRELIALSCDKGLTEACRYLNGEEKTGSEKIFWASLLLMGLAVFIITNTFFQEEEEFKAQEQLENDKNEANSASRGIVLRYSRPFFKRYFSPIVGNLKNKKRIKEKYRRPLAASGLSQILTPEDFFSFKLFLILGFPLVFLFLRLFLEEDWSLSYIALLAIVGFFYPDVWIRSVIGRRREAILLNMPFVVDMLALSVEAGLDFIAAMQKVIDKSSPNPLRDELEILMKEIKIGASRAEGLRNMAWRIDLSSMSSFCATLIAADSVGASIGPILKTLSVEMRNKRSTQLEKKGQTAATKILFPVIFLIVPSVFLMIGTPFILEFISNQ